MIEAGPRPHELLIMAIHRGAWIDFADATDGIPRLKDVPKDLVGRIRPVAEEARESLRLAARLHACETRPRTLRDETETPGCLVCGKEIRAGYVRCLECGVALILVDRDHPDPAFALRGKEGNDGDYDPTQGGEDAEHRADESGR
jgi:hypothetical protein